MRSGSFLSPFIALMTFFRLRPLIFSPVPCSPAFSPFAFSRCLPKSRLPCNQAAKYLSTKNAGAIPAFVHGFSGHQALEYSGNFCLYFSIQSAMISSAYVWSLMDSMNVFLPSSALYTEKKWDISFMMCSGSSLMSS